MGQANDEDGSRKDEAQQTSSQADRSIEFVNKSPGVHSKSQHQKDAAKNVNDDTGRPTGNDQLRRNRNKFDEGKDETVGVP